MDWHFKVDNNICDVRVAGILIQNNKILVQKDKDGNEYALPGGHVQIGEITADALVREYKEELGVVVDIKKLVWTEECFFEWNDKKAHNFCFYYLIELRDGDLDFAGFIPHRDNENVVVGWLPLDEVIDVIIYPEFLKTEIDKIEERQKHFVTKA